MKYRKVMQAKSYMWILENILNNWYGRAFGKMNNKQIEEMINSRNKEMDIFVEKARNGCVCHGVGMMLQRAISEMQEDGFNIKYIIDDTIKMGGGKNRKYRSGVKK